MVLECEKESVLGSRGREPVFEDPDNGILGRVEGRGQRPVVERRTDSESLFHESRTIGGPNSSKKSSSWRS